METLNTRTQEFVGTIRKCPNCGAELPGMVAICPQCGHEITGVGANVSVREFFDNYQKEIDTIRKIDMINNYPIPNVKEDLIEFALIASQQLKAELNARTNRISFMNSNFDGKRKVIGNPFSKKYHENFNDVNTYAEDFLSAWEAKLDQVRLKAEIVLASDSSALFQINKIFSDVSKLKTKFENKKERIKKLNIAIIVIIVVATLVLSIFLVTVAEKPAKNETARLEALQKEILMDIKNNDYDMAELKLSELRWSIYPDGSTYKSEVQSWNQKRELLQNQIDSKRKEY